MNRRAMLLLTATSGCRRGGARAVRIATQGGTFVQMPISFAETLGYYREEGVPVEMQHLTSSSKVLEAWNAGSADVISGSYEFALRMTAEGRPLCSFLQITSRDGRSILAAPGRTDIRTVADLRGKKVGVSGFGSGTHDFVRYALARHSVRDDDVSFIAIGTGMSAVMALERGIVDAISPTSAEHYRLKAKFPGLVAVLDVSTPEGSKAFWGSAEVPFMVLLASPSWLSTNAQQARLVARAVKKTLIWIRHHSPEQIRQRMAEPYLTADTAGDLETIRMSKAQFSPDGLMPSGGPEIIHRALAAIQPRIRDARIDLSATHTNEFARDNP